MVSIAPCYVIFTIQIANSGIVAIFPLQKLLLFIRIFAFSNKLDRSFLNVPIDSVLAEAGKQIHAQCLAVATKYSCKPIFITNDCAVKDTV